MLSKDTPFVKYFEVKNVYISTDEMEEDNIEENYNETDNYSTMDEEEMEQFEQEIFEEMINDSDEDIVKEAIDTFILDSSLDSPISPLLSSESESELD